MLHPIAPANLRDGLCRGYAADAVHDSVQPAQGTANLLKSGFHMVEPRGIKGDRRNLEFLRQPFQLGSVTRCQHELGTRLGQPARYTAADATRGPEYHIYGGIVSVVAHSGLLPMGGRLL
ncbi:MAG: hypothetical protein BWY79_01409 [Actinobacteria bacterium ADurb.Bin444]|nr:MAG: hypothetical protein BWY79_01409 [Actinobacteria bacterium ADurb.Bin444]